MKEASSQLQLREKELTSLRMSLQERTNQVRDNFIVTDFIMSATDTTSISTQYRDIMQFLLSHLIYT